jgi:hypothetical protein
VLISVEDADADGANRACTDIGGNSGLGTCTVVPDIGMDAEDVVGVDMVGVEAVVGVACIDLPGKGVAFDGRLDPEGVDVADPLFFLSFSSLLSDILLDKALAREANRLRW